ncbi:hypothetical protein VTK56DRAFT_3141 [Thermocarpiscus australiensis]
MRARCASHGRRGGLNNWHMYLTWQKDRMEAAWVPTTGQSNEEAKMSEDGKGVCHWKHDLWTRAHKARAGLWASTCADLSRTRFRTHATNVNWLSNH